ELEGPDHVFAELERHHDQTLHHERRVGDALVARHVVDDYRFAGPGDVLAHRGRIRRGLAAVRAPDLPAIGEAERALLTPIDAKVAPVHQAMRQPLDPGERVLEADVHKQHQPRGLVRSIRANESSRLMLLVITASMAWILFSSSAAIASSSVCLKSKP